jgi:hypothetical protein
MESITPGYGGVFLTDDGMAFGMVYWGIEELAADKLIMSTVIHIHGDGLDGGGTWIDVLYRYTFSKVQ